MSRAANVYDNAFMESCFGMIKTELEMHGYENDTKMNWQLARSLVNTSDCYNTRRRHSSLDYHTPEQFEAVGANCRRKRTNEKTS